MRSARTTGRWLVALLLLAASLGPAAHGHGLITLNVQVPPQADCPAERARCLDTVEPQPPLHPGDHADLLVWNDANESHEILVAPNASADPAHEDTPADAAIASVEVPANASRDAGSLLIPEGTEALYVWCDRPGHEAEGEWMRVPVEPAPETDGGNGAPLGAGVAVGVLLAAAGIAFTRRTRRGRP